MVNFCAVYGCSNRAIRNKDKSYFRLPAVISRYNPKKQALSKERRDKWISAIRRADLSPSNYPYTRVCSDHFISGKPSSIYDTDNPDWCPNQNLGHNYSQTKTSNLTRYERSTEREEKRRKSESADALLQLSLWAPNKLAETTLDDEIDIRGNCQTDLTSKEIDSLYGKIEELEKENRSIKEKLSRYILDQDTFRGDDEKTLNCTGLPNLQLLFSLFDFIKECLPEHSGGCLNSFQKLILVLMKMKLDVNCYELGYRFGGISTATVYRTFKEVIDVLNVCLKPLIIWPDRDALKKTLPMDFRKHSPNCVVIIDCFEIFLGRPANPLARAQTYSSYKHHNTYKYLIGITPQGTVSFISDGWGGRVSDKHLTENCGILENLIPGDVILADRGFDIGEAVGLLSSTIKLPSFTKGKKQLSGIEVEQTRRIAKLRIHVERVIGNIRKKYSILHATQPIDFVKVRSGDVPTLDKTVAVCCGLVNTCDSVVPYE